MLHCRQRNRKDKMNLNYEYHSELECMMDIRALRYFVEVVERRSFSRAAEQLHVTQPTVSKMIQQLEQSLGLVLLERIGKRFTLTDAGNVVLQSGRALLALHGEWASSWPTCN